MGEKVTIIIISSCGIPVRGDPLPPSIPHKYDVILAADCVYFEPAFPLLVKTLTDLVPDKSVEVLFCYKKRRKVRSICPNSTMQSTYRTGFAQADKRFFTLLKKEFTWTEVGLRSGRHYCLSQTYPQVEDDASRETYIREAISLLRLVRK